jgi:hypothetical protein
MKKMLCVILVVCLCSGCTFSSDPFPELKEIVFTEQAADPSVAVVISAPDNPYLDQLRQEFSLDALRGENDLDTILAVTHWVHNLWRHDGSNVPAKSDPISILRDVHAGARYRCVEYSIVIAGSLNALGIPTRILSLRTEDMQTRESGAGHVVCEAYLADSNQWVMIDGQWNVVPYRHGEPIHAAALQPILQSDPDSIELRTLEKIRKDSYLRWIGPYLYFFMYRLDQRFVNELYTDWSVMLVPSGEAFPQVFQIVFPIENVHFTHNLSDFYQAPLQEPPQQE